ncbi:MAG TPA: DNA repair protein RadC [Gammaproteobacteria bacterium]|nr:hypothetical protein BMS3Abin11_00353 [bacterium BMS3Abin11]GMT40443.1 MAG: hypothetical protein IEMM0001_1178 [bacterium]HDH15005.1 DNA repair protein RadC [Gammaproteobacteria bacterium]
MIKKTGKGTFCINGSFTVSELANVLLENSGDYFNTEGQPLTSPDSTREYLKAVLSHHESEVFGVIFMDNRHRVQAFEILFYGTIDGASVHPREVVKRAIANNSAAVILTHNHPSGIPEPSQADIALTSRLKDALALIDIRVLDHFIVGEAEPLSFSERGLM